MKAEKRTLSTQMLVDVVRCRVCTLNILKTVLTDLEASENRAVLLTHADVDVYLYTLYNSHVLSGPSDAVRKTVYKMLLQCLQKYATDYKCNFVDNWEFGSLLISRF